MNGLLSRIALAFGIGLLIGLERGWSSRRVRAGGRAAGVRTFAITGLLGGLVGAMARTATGDIELPGAVLIGFALVAYASLITIFSRAENRANGTSSATTAVAAVLTFTLGVYASCGDIHIAAAAAVATAGILALREGIHGWIEKITRRELESALVLLAMTFIALPVVPARAIGPLGGINIREVWIIAITLASVSFAGYIAIRYFGEKRGVLLSAGIGGLVSSTAVALASARSAAAKEGSPTLLSAGTALATAVSFVRVTAIVGVLAPSAVVLVGIPLAVAALTACSFALSAARSSPAMKTSTDHAEFRNPFGFWSVVAIAVSMGVLILLGRFINDRFGEHGTILGAATMGLFDVDAMTVSMAGLVASPAVATTAAQAILAGVASNTLVKAVIAAVIGRGRFAFQVGGIALACIGAGAIAMLALSAAA